MKKILLLSTGGTIASRKTEQGLAPKLTPEELLAFLPQPGSFCQIDTMQLLNLDSTNICPEHWLIPVSYTHLQPRIFRSLYLYWDEVCWGN